MKKLLFICCFSLEIFLVKSNDTLRINIADLAKINPQICKVNKSSCFKKEVIYYQAKNQKGITLLLSPQVTNWDSLNYLVLDLYHENPYSLAFYLYFFKSNTGNAMVSIQQSGQENKIDNQSPTFTAKIGLLPRLRTQLIFPLSYLDNQQIFIKRFPRQMKGVIFGQHMDKKQISKIMISFEPYQSPDFMGTLEIADAYLCTNLPQPLPNNDTPIVDQFGQWSEKEWPGKIHSQKELIEKMHALAQFVSNATFPSSWSQYGGWKELKLKTTGYFHTQYVNNRWWLVDPEGNAFLSAGIDCINDEASCPVTGFEDLFSWLPPSDNDLYHLCYSSQNKNEQMINFHRSNWIRAFGNEWKNQWLEITSGLIRKGSINTIACWSDLQMAKKIKLPYLFFMNNFPTTEAKLFRDFPDVFSKQYQLKATSFAQQLEQVKEDPYMIGYFLNNEPQWAFGEYNLAFEMFSTTQSSETKNEFVRWIKYFYNNNLDQFNAHWKMKILSLEELAYITLPDFNTLSKIAQSQLYDFTKIMVRKYVSVVCQEVQKIDKNHLNLGLRYAWVSSDLCYEAGSYFDVFSINGYTHPVPPDTREITRRSGKPVMIGEFHFGALDAGLPANGIQGAENQKARGDAYRYYVENGFARPEVVGIHYFQWLDQPVTGRFDGEDYNIGFVDICNQPYYELYNAAKTTHERMYKVASGVLQPFALMTKKMPQVCY